MKGSPREGSSRVARPCHTEGDVCVVARIGPLLGHCQCYDLVPMELTGARKKPRIGKEIKVWLTGVPLGLAGGADQNGLRKGSARLEMVAELVQHGVKMGKNRSMPITCRPVATEAHPFTTRPRGTIGPHLNHASQTRALQWQQCIPGLIPATLAGLWVSPFTRTSHGDNGHQIAAFFLKWSCF